MRTSFGIKLGLLLMLLTTALVGGMLLYFNKYSSKMLQADLTQSITDVTKTGAMVFHREDREILESLRTQLYQVLPDDYLEQVDKFVRKKAYVYAELLPEEDSNALQQSDEFQYIVQLLRRIQEGSRDRLEALDFLPQTNVKDNNASKVAWAYLMVTIPNVSAQDAIMFVADSNYEVDNVSPEGNPIGNMYEGGGFFTKPFAGEVGTSDGWYEDQFGRVMTAIIPIKNDAGEVIASLGVDYNVNTYTTRVDEQLTTSWIVFGIAILTVFVMSAVITIWISVPLAKLRSGAEQLSQQDFDHIIRINSKDEFGLLAKTMNRVSRSLGELTRNLDGIVKQRTEELSQAQEEVLLLNQKLKEENAHLGAEVESLIELRHRLMPKANKTFNHQGYQVSCHYLPSQSVGGDFWQVLKNNEDKPELVVGHVSGYGLETATTAMQIQGVFAASNEGATNAFYSINRFLHQMAEATNLKLFCKAISVEFEESGLVLNGQLEDPIVYSAGSAARFLELSENSLPLGLQIEASVSESLVDLAEGETLLLYSSGLVNALTELHRQSSSKPFNPTADNLIEVSGLAMNSAQELEQTLLEQEWFTELSDDVCFVAITKKAD